MYQFKTNNHQRQSLKFGKPKSPYTQKTPSTALFKNVPAASAVKPEFIKSPTHTWKKGVTTTFPNRPQTTHTRFSSGKPTNLTDSLPLDQKEPSYNKYASSVETSRQTQNSNPNSISTQSILKSRSSEIDLIPQPVPQTIIDQSDKIERMELDINNLKHKLTDAVRKKDQFERRLQEATDELATVKQTNREQSKKIIELTNANNQLEADYFIASKNLKEREESDSTISKQNELKRLIVTLSQQKNELANKVSELLQKKAQQDNTETFNKIQKANAQNELENTRIEQLQEIQSLKSRINELELQQNTNEKEYYEERIRLLEKQVKQLLMKCMSSGGVDGVQRRQIQQGNLGINSALASRREEKISK